MRFEFTVALKYLIPRWQQLSVSIISLISVLVISLVVWLIMIFLSVTEGIEKKWVEELVALNAPVRMTPTDAYYQSYYYQIDTVALDSNYSTKTIGEKKEAIQTDPYDPRADIELACDFPPPDRFEDGQLKDIVKEGFEAASSLPFSGIRAQEYEMAFANLRLQILRKGLNPDELQQNFLTQVSYIASHDGENRRVNQMILPLTAEDFNNMLESISRTNAITEDEGTDKVIQPTQTVSKNLVKFFSDLEINELKTANGGFVLNPSLFPKQGNMKGVGVVRFNQIVKIMVPQALSQIAVLNEKFSAFGYQTTLVDLLFDEKQLHISSEESFSASPDIQIILDENIPFTASVIENSLKKAHSLSSIAFNIEGKIQQISIAGKTSYSHMEISKAAPKAQAPSARTFWVTAPMTAAGCHIPCTTESDLQNHSLGEGLLISKSFKNNGVKLGDNGYLSYYAQTGSSMQEQRIPVYVAGFYDPGMMPVGNKLIFVDPSILPLLRGNTSVADSMLSNGINIWLDHLEDAASVKQELIKSLNARGISKYWEVESYHDYEFTRPILEQLQSDKNLFTLIAFIILIVACSNIISMLILLVNDKRKEIGIMQSMGASPRRIAFIFGFCGFVLGLASCIIGIAAAMLTLKNLQSLIDLLSFLQGRDAFQAAFYGSRLPNDLSYSALLFVVLATLAISLLAGLIPAIKASKIRPTEILKSE